MTVAGADLRKWAVVGAQQRLAQIDEEAAAIRRAFPDLRRGNRATHAGASLGVPNQDTNQPRRRRRKLSPEGRARIIAAQKARWAKQKGQASPEASAAPAEKKTSRKKK